MKFYLQVFNVDFGINEKYENSMDWDSTSKLITKHSSKFSQKTKPEFGDIMMLRVMGLPAHLGIYLDEKSFLHTMEKTDSIIDKVKAWDNKILGFYRYDKS